MEAKKTPKADLERKRFLFLEIGIVVSLSLCLVAFEWSQEELGQSDLGNMAITNYLEQDIQITRPEPPPEQEPEQEPEPEKIPITIVITEDTVAFNADLFNSDSKINNDYKIITPNIPVEIPVEILDVIDFHYVEVKPIFSGGDAALLKFIMENTKYPEIPKRNNVQGKVHVRFVISQSGQVIDVTVLNSVDPYLAAEAIRVVSSIPAWIPGRQGDKPVPVSFIVPINFTLR